MGVESLGADRWSAAGGKPLGRGLFIFQAVGVVRSDTVRLIFTPGSPAEVCRESNPI